VRDLARAILDLTGVRPAAALVGADGRTALNALCLRRTRGLIEYCLVLGNKGGPDPGKTQLTLARAAHLYDVGAHRYLGHSARTSVEPSATRGRLIAALPYRVEGLRLSVPATCRQGEAIRVCATFDTGRDRPGDHVLRLEVTRPDGSVCPWWTANVLAPTGRHEAVWNTALDESPGPWRVRAIDPLSGQTAEATVELRKS
jgi:hypothetical protein